MVELRLQAVINVWMKVIMVSLPVPADPLSCLPHFRYIVAYFQSTFESLS